MADVMEGQGMNCHTPSNHGKINAALTTGIIGTSLSGLLALGALGVGGSLLGGRSAGRSVNYGPDYGNGYNYGIPYGPLYNERNIENNYVDLTKQYFRGQMANAADLNRKFFSLYKLNQDSVWEMTRRHAQDSFDLYRGQRDQKDELNNKINELERKIDIMSAIRPYQDALINNKIDNVAMVSDFNLAKRTCRMIQGELILPSKPEVSGYPSYSCGCCPAATPA